ncbi:hypothetical protein [Pseudarthrobacter sp. ATCC 49987]|uniref:hypothetical protein n=1 Tax=Pseudarthrobacter sp. ATCC 49987 TaxID=2698204 RepID=UPI00136B3D75|nr:hypothetical protein [Pseudarthrobacter sp. ATCC 49987]
MLPVLIAAHAGTGVYYSKTDVRFLPPLPIEGNVFQADPLQVVPFASIVVHRFNADDRDESPRSTSAPLYGSGVRTGHLVYLPNSGSQWQVSYSRAVITVEVVGESADDVAVERDRIVKHISELAEATQQERDIGPPLRITTELDRTTAFITYVGVRNTRAELALTFLTVGLAVGIPLAADPVIVRLQKVTGSRTRTSGGTQRRMPTSTSSPDREDQIAPPVT